MANALETIEQGLPNGTLYSEQDLEYSYRAFKVSPVFLVEHPQFDWLDHIGQTFSNCLRGTIHRFTTVV